ncbi:MAG: hypothetical protein B7X35_02330 [Halothiobacillus sp. 14-56-357]|jgi:ElaB/YqjD/DUF883 family membrane-anchored ribosome-binding protein|uniref:DUF883 family protein n=1 Tax=Halothiobacillus sp. 15-55-196 TaxID=1970382 RepID=UPI000BDC59A1|nr:hypothetical protein [Halothiobacillus sp. 15-55-196]OZB37805.1 MAG: hypothetical protein B7X44_00440 [Halothiobacillus sp. 15-55-196]OZB57184.1 MAG: hypothetical protein B7X35_02330 [Halothiobacillus sp. 14-56-357]OZB77958.1 MAG: hypothetical protein B7X29_06725 [Halothiobacillus sp. 13-55-115]
MATAPKTTDDTLSATGNEELAAIKQDMHQLKADLAELLTAMKTRGQNKAEALGQDAINTLHDAIDTLNQRVNAAKEGVSEKTRATVDQAEQVIERHPVASLLAAFGIGFVLAKLFSKN